MKAANWATAMCFFVKFQCSKVIVWYPCLDEQQLSGLYQQAGSLGLQLLVAEFAVQTTQLDALERSGAPGLNQSTWAEEHHKHHRDLCQLT